MSYRERYIEAHSLEFDILHSDCRDCYLQHRECEYYTTGCRKEGE